MYQRLADRLRAPWIALLIETSRTLNFDEEVRDRIVDTLRLAERCAELITIPGSARRIADDIVSFAHATTTQIVVGKTTRSRWFELLNGSVVHDLVRRAG